VIKFSDQRLYQALEFRKLPYEQLIGDEHICTEQSGHDTNKAGSRAKFNNVFAIERASAD
jgi:hypothetical protein